MKWFFKLDRWLQIVLVIVLVIIAYWLYITLRDYFRSKDYQATVTQSVTAIHQLGQQGIHPSYAEAQYSSYANTLKGAFEGCSAAGGSNKFWDTITPIFSSMKNDADVYSLIRAYGVRTIDKCGLFTGNFEGDLAGTLSEKFSGLEGTLIGAGEFKGIDTINSLMKKNGSDVTFQF